MPRIHRPTGGLHRIHRLLTAIARRLLGVPRPRPTDKDEPRE